MKPVVLMVPQLPAAFVAELAQDYELIGPLERSSREALPQGAARAEALLTIGGLPTDAALIDALPQLRLIACYGTGYEGVDRAHAARRGIALTNAGDANADSVAEFALGLMLAATRDIALGDRFVRNGRWAGNAVERLPIAPGLSGRRLGIFGLGAIGQRVATRAAVFGMAIGYHNRSRKAELDYAYFETLPELAQWADVLLVAVRASDQTRHAIDAPILAALGKHGYLVNISRGSTVDEDALCDALDAGQLAGAALDVYQNEPDVAQRIRRQERIVLTPHIGANAALAQAEQMRVMKHNLAAVFAGQPLRNRVDA